MLGYNPIYYRRQHNKDKELSQQGLIYPTLFIFKVLSTEAVIGIGVGAGVLVIIAIVIAVVLICCAR